MLSLFLDLIDDPSDQELFKEIYFKYEKPMLYFAQGILSDYHRAEDATQDTFLKVARNIKTLRGAKDNDIRNYLLIAIKHTVWDIVKKEQKLKMASVDFLENIKDEKTSREIDNLGNDSLIVKVLNQLPQKYTDAMYLHFVMDMKTKEVAHILNIKAGTARQHISRGRKMFIELYEREINTQ